MKNRLKQVDFFQKKSKNYSKLSKNYSKIEHLNFTQNLSKILTQIFE
jgi:thymidylate kinase